MRLTSIPPLAAFLCLAALPARAAEPAPSQEAFFETQVRPLLVNSCQRCHGPKKQESGLRVDSRTALMRGGSAGPALVSGKPADSLLIKAVKHQGELHMPPDKKLKPEQVAILTWWIEMGAPWPRETVATVFRSGEVTPEERLFWSFQPVRKPPVPEVKNRSWIRSPIDAFILARLEAAGIEPAPDRGPAHADSPRHVRPDRIAADARGDRARSSPIRRRTRSQGGRSLAGVAGLWRTLGPALARRRPLRRHRRRDGRLSRAARRTCIAITSSTLSTATSPTISSSASRSPATCWPARHRARSTPRWSPPPASWPSRAASASIPKTTTT